METRMESPAAAAEQVTSRFMAWLRSTRAYRFLFWFVIAAVCVMVYVVIYRNVTGEPSIQNLNFWSSRDSQDAQDFQDGQRKALVLEAGGSAAVKDAIRLKGTGRSEGGKPRLEVDLMVPVRGKAWRDLKSAMKQVEASAFSWKPAKETQVDCSKLFSGDKAEQERAGQVVPAQALTAKNITSLATTCRTFKENFGFITSPLTDEERDFPIAFSIVTFKDAEQVLNLLRAIYRPQNYYCIHVDTKSDGDFRDAMAAISGCFPNVFLSSRSVDVQWGQFSVLETDLICMADLWRFKTWKYFINLTGQEFPLRTNYELVRILKVFNGSNSLEGTRKRANKDRWSSADKPPGGIELTKGSVHVTVNRDFVDFVLHNSLGQKFLNWSRNVGIPDETFFSSLNHNPHLGIRGTYTGEAETDPTTYPFITRFKNWGGYPFDYPCEGGKRVRLICILSTGDLPLLDQRPELFANKFYSDYSHVALGCLAERIFNHTRDEYLGNMEFNTSYYAGLPFVTNTVKTSTFNRTS